MFDFLIAAAAVATIASFLLELIRELKLKRKDDKGEKKKSQR